MSAMDANGAITACELKFTDKVGLLFFFSSYYQSFQLSIKKRKLQSLRL